MCVPAKGLRHDFLELEFDLQRVLPRGEARAVAHAKDVRVHRERFLTERSVEHDIRSLSTNAG